MIKTAVVEDEKSASDLIVNYLKEYGEKIGEQFDVKVFRDAVSFLEEYQPIYDIVFLDIVMPNMDGMTAAKRLRLTDRRVVLVFVTSMSGYAVKGYEVEATAFITKPVAYDNFIAQTQRAVDAVKSRDCRVLFIPSGTKKLRVMIRDLMYIEVRGHVCTYHLTDGDVDGRNKLSSLAKELEKYDFMMCSNSFLINPVFIKAIDSHTVKVGDDVLEISRLKKQDFLKRFNEWAAGSGK